MCMFLLCILLSFVLSFNATTLGCIQINVLEGQKIGHYFPFSGLIEFTRVMLSVNDGRHDALIQLWQLLNFTVLASSTWHSK